jgi:putative intracellular protease/amidase/YHS domain-containing protein
MNRRFSRREIIQMSAGFGLFARALPSSVFSAPEIAAERRAQAGVPPGSPLPNLLPPASGKIPVAFVISEGAVMIDFAGPWEVFQDARNPQTKAPAFRLYTVAESTAAIHASGGMKIVPDFSVQNAPPPKVIVIPAQQSESAALLNWIRESSKHADLTMSVCTGAFLLAKTGLLDNRTATTHHSAYKSLAAEYPNVRVQRGLRWVEDGTIASAGGLSSGIDLALRTVERYFGREVAQQTADEMEYQGQGWLDPSLNSVYSVSPKSTETHPICIVCGMDADPNLKTQYRGTTYYFCSEDHKHQFEAAPDKYTS